MATKKAKQKVLQTIPKSLNPSGNQTINNETCVTEKHLNRVALKISKEEVKTLADIFNIAKEEQEIVEGLSLAHNYPEKEVIFQILKRWKDIKRNEATLSELYKALKKIGKQQVMEFVLQSVYTDETEVFLTIAANLKLNTWKVLATKLGVKASLVEDSDKKNKNQENTVKMLNIWKQTKKPGKEMISILVKALTQLGRYDIAQKIKKGDFTKELPRSNNESLEVLSDEVEKEVTSTVANKLDPDEWRLFGRELGLETKHLDELDEKQKETNFGNKEKITRMIETWKEIEKPGNQFTPKLKTALNTIERSDIIKDIDKILRTWKNRQKDLKDPNSTLQTNGLPKEVEREIINVIAKKLGKDDFTLLARKLKLVKEDLDELMNDQKEKNLTNEEKTIRMIEKWRKVKNPGYQFIEMLLKALSEIERHDIVVAIEERIHPDARATSELEDDIPDQGKTICNEQASISVQQISIPANSEQLEQTEPVLDTDSLLTRAFVSNEVKRINLNSAQNNEVQFKIHTSRMVSSETENPDNIEFTKTHVQQTVCTSSSHTQSTISFNVVREQQWTKEEQIVVPEVQIMDGMLIQEEEWESNSDEEKN